MPSWCWRARTEELLNEGQRAALWRAFRVPVFEQILADDGSLLAMECEAHDGLHVESARLAADVENGEGMGLELGPCGCGRTTPRIGGSAAIGLSWPQCEK